MPIYSFSCKRCEFQFDESCSLSDDSGSFYTSTGYDRPANRVICPECKSKRLQKLLTSPTAITFSNPKGTSKEDNFEYVAKHNYERAQQESAAARAKHAGRLPYKNIDDTSRGMKMNYNT